MLATKNSIIEETTAPIAIAIRNGDSIPTLIYIAIDGTIAPGIGIPPKVAAVDKIITFIVPHRKFRCHVWGYDDETKSWKHLWSDTLNAFEGNEGFIWNGIRIESI